MLRQKMSVSRYNEGHLFCDARCRVLRRPRLPCKPPRLRPRWGFSRWTRATSLPPTTAGKGRRYRLRSCALFSQTPNPFPSVCVSSVLAVLVCVYEPLRSFLCGGGESIMPHQPDCHVLEIDIILISHKIVSGYERRWCS